MFACPPMEVFWARMVHGATERLLLLLGWERRAVSARAGVTRPPQTQSLATTVGAGGGATARATARATASNARATPVPRWATGRVFGTEAPKLNMRPSQPPTHVAGDPYAWNADPFAVGAAPAPCKTRVPHGAVWQSPEPCLVSRQTWFTLQLLKHCVPPRMVKMSGTPSQSVLRLSREHG